jgi:hypothetical protein
MPQANLADDTLPAPEDAGNQAALMQRFISDLLNALPAFEAAFRVSLDGKQGAQDNISAAIKTLADINKKTMTKAGAINTQIEHEEAIPLLTQLPIDGLINVMPSTRDHKVPDFTGDNTDKRPCQDWLAMIMDIAESATLSYDCTIKLMARHSAGAAGRTVREGIRIKLPLREIVRRLEVRYSGLMHVDTARLLCNSTTLKSNESLGQLAERLHTQAYMATRLQLDHVQQVKDQEELATTNFLRCLSEDLRTHINDRIKGRRLTGLPPYTYGTLCAEVDELQKRTEAYKPKAASFGHTVGTVHAQTDKQDEPDAQEQGKKTAEPDKDLIVAIVAAMEKSQGYRRNRSPTPYPSKSTGKDRRSDSRRGQNYGSSGRNSRGRQRSFSRGRSESRGRRQRSRESSQVRRVESDSKKNTSRPSRGYDRSQSRDRRQRSASSNPINPGDFNVDRDDCLRCGKNGHRMTSSRCPLAGVPLASRPCYACNKGAHYANQCPKN